MSAVRRDCRVYIGNLPPDIRQRDLEDLFCKYGRINFIDVKLTRGAPFAFIEFDDPRDARDAIRARDGYEIDGCRIRVEMTRGVGPRGPGGRPLYGYDRDSRRPPPSSRAPPRRSGFRVHVIGLPTTGSWQDLKDHMREAGDICYADVFKDGTGVVEYTREDDMRYAIKKLDDTKFRSHEGETSYIRVKESLIDRKNRSRSRTRSRSPRGSPQYSPHGSRSVSRSPLHHSASSVHSDLSSLILSINRRHEQLKKIMTGVIGRASDRIRAGDGGRCCRRRYQRLYGRILISQPPTATNINGCVRLAYSSSYLLAAGGGLKPMELFGKRSVKTFKLTKNLFLNGNKNGSRSERDGNTYKRMTVRSSPLKAKLTVVKVPYPKELTDYLDQYVVGQEHAKKTLAVGVYQHYKRFSHNASLNMPKSDADEREIFIPKRRSPGLSLASQAKYESIIVKKIMQKNPKNAPKPASIDEKIRELENEKQCLLDKSNIMLIGPSGVGKTYLTQMLAKILNVPFAMCDCTVLTQAGYVGDDVESVVQKLLDNADGDVETAQSGIIFLDEFDKISTSTDQQSRMFRDVGGRGVQQAFLKIVEGTMVKVRNSSCGGQKVNVDTTNILFVASGAFNNLEKIVSKRLNEKLVGFGNKQEQLRNDRMDDMEERKVSEYRDKLLRLTDHADIIKFGMVPELVGRFPVIVPFQGLTTELLVRILTEPKRSVISQAERQFQLDNVHLTFTNCALQEIARIAAQKKTGARALRSIIERVLLDAKFEIPGSTIRSVVIDANVVRGNSRYIAMVNADSQRNEALDVSPNHEGKNTPEIK